MTEVQERDWRPMYGPYIPEALEADKELSWAFSMIEEGAGQ